MTIVERVKKEFKKYGVDYSMIQETENSYWGFISILNCSKSEVEFEKSLKIKDVKYLVQDYVNSYNNYIKDLGY